MVDRGSWFFNDVLIYVEYRLVFSHSVTYHGDEVLSHLGAVGPSHIVAYGVIVNINVQN